MRKGVMIIVMVYFMLFLALSPVKAYQHIQIPVLMYHHLDEQPGNNAVISRASFDNQMKLLKKAGYQTITAAQLYHYLIGGIKFPKNPVLITFDDGYLSNYTIAYPILKKYNMQAEIFVITSRILNNGENNKAKEIPKLSWEQLREMEGTITTQSHGWDLHFKLKMRDGSENAAIFGPGLFNNRFEKQVDYEARVLSDLMRSKNIIREKLGYVPIAMSYPYGIYSADAVKLAKRAGFKMAFIINNDYVQRGDQLLTLNRITITENDTGIQFLNKLTSTPLPKRMFE